jgi:hypothetical protein
VRTEPRAADTYTSANAAPASKAATKSRCDRGGVRASKRVTIENVHRRLLMFNRAPVWTGLPPVRVSQRTLLRKPLEHPL